MRTSNILRMFVLASAAVASVSAHNDAVQQERQLTVAQDGMVSGFQNFEETRHVSRILKKHKATPAPVEEDTATTTDAATAPATEADTPAASTQDEVPATAPAAPAVPGPASRAAPAAPAKKKATKAPVPAPEPEPAADPEPAPTPAPAPKKTKKKVVKEPVIEETAEEINQLNDTRIRGDKNEGVLDGSSEGTAEIDKIDLRNKDRWVSVYNDPPLLVIKASLYAFISYNDTNVCDNFNMTLNAVEEKSDGNGTHSYHVVTYINCTKNGYDETPGRFVLNFIPEGSRLLLTECGHREENEIVNWLKITDEVPECMTPGERRKFLAQPMKHIHASNGTANFVPVQTDFMTRLEEGDVKEVAIVGSATVALIAVFVVIIVFIGRKRKAQKDLERTIAGAKADQADEEDDKSEKEDDASLMENTTAKSTDADVQEEGSFVNSPAVKV